MKKWPYVILAIVAITVAGCFPARTADQSYLADTKDPTAIWWASLIFFNGDDGNFIQYMDKLEPVPQGAGVTGWARCKQVIEELQPLVQELFPDRPWAVTCVPISADTPDNIHRYNASNTLLDDWDGVIPPAGQAI